MTFYYREKLTQKFAQHCFPIDSHYSMKILYPNINVLDITSNCRDNAKEQCICISIVIPIKRNGWVKRSEIEMKDIIGTSVAYALLNSKKDKIFR